jgi:hypothetical protein
MNWNALGPQREAARDARAAAKLGGEMLYSTGRPCRNGHSSPRYTSTGTCVECTAIRVKRHKTINPTRARETSKASYLRHRDKALARGRAHYQEDLEGQRERGRRSYAANREQRRAADRAKRANNPEPERARQRLKRQRHRERIAAYNRRYKQRNRALYAAAQKAREQRLRNAMPPWADPEAIKAIYAEAARLTAETGVRHEVDHVIPLQHDRVCGLHVETNLQVLTRSANARKGNGYAD